MPVDLAAVRLVSYLSCAAATNNRLQRIFVRFKEKMSGSRSSSALSMRTVTNLAAEFGDVPLDVEKREAGVAD